MSLKFWFMQSPNVVNLRQYKKTFFKTTDYASVPRQPDVGRKINDNGYCLSLNWSPATVAGRVWADSPRNFPS